MSYLGEKPAQTLAAPTSQYFNGDGSTVAFTLNRAVNVAEDLDVFVNNVRQEPGVGKSYTATGTTLTFDAAPSSGTANVYVVYRGLAEVTTRLEHDANAALAATTGTFSGDLTVDTNTLYVDSTNNRVGMGTASPSYKLHSTTSDGSDYAGYFYNTAGSGSGTSLVARGGANNPTPNFQVQDYNGNADFTVTGNGYVGIGTASPAQKFVVTNAGANNIVMCENSSASIQMFMQAQSGVGAVGTLTNHDTVFLSNNTQRVRIDTSGNVMMNTTDYEAGIGNSSGSPQFSFRPADGLRTSTTGSHYFNKFSDGVIIQFRGQGTDEGSISISGTTVSYNGGHLSRWSQLADNTRDESIVKGTVMTNLDQMAEWTNEGVTEENEQLNCMAVSSVEGDANVAGVFVNWDNEDDIYTNDMNVAMTGDMVIRIAQDTTVQRGDLLMSAGDGTAKPQGDDIIRSKTIAKVTSTHVSHTYDDGSYLVPCVLMAC